MMRQQLLRSSRHRSQMTLNKYPAFPKTRLIDASNAANYTISGATASSTVVDSEWSGGKSVLDWTFGVTQSSILKTFAPIDMRYGSIVQWIRRMEDSVGNLNIGVIDLWSGGGAAPPANYHQLGIRVDVPSAGYWIGIGGSIQEAIAVGTGADLSAITGARLRFNTTASPVHLRVSDLTFRPNPRSKGVVIFRIDDGALTAFTVLKPEFDAAGVKMFLAPGAISQTLGGTGNMTVAQALQMHNEGHQVGSQAYDTELVPGDGSYAAYLAQYAAMLQYGKDKGWPQDSVDGTYYSSVSLTTANARRAQLASGVRTIQNFKNGAGAGQPIQPYGECFPFRDESNVFCLNIAAPGHTTSGTDPSTAGTIANRIKTAVEQVIATRGVLVIGGHNDMGTNVDQIAAWRYVLQRYTAGAGAEFDILTPNQLLNPYLAQYGGSTYPIIGGI